MGICYNMRVEEKKYMYHYSLPVSSYRYSWKFVPEPICPLNIPGYKVRTFSAYSNSNSPTAPVKIAFFVNTYYKPHGKGQDKVMQEIFYPNSLAGKWEPVPPKLVKMGVEANPEDFLSEYHVKFSIEEVEGRAFLTTTIADWKTKITGYRILPTVGLMDITPGGKVAAYCGLAMATMAQYPDKLRTFADVEKAWNAFAELNNLNHSGSEAYIKSQINWFRKQVEEEAKEIERYTKQEQEISETAAEAMNELSERFGIEIAL